MSDELLQILEPIAVHTISNGFSAVIWDLTDEWVEWSYDWDNQTSIRYRSFEIQRSMILYEIQDDEPRAYFKQERGRMFYLDEFMKI